MMVQQVEKIIELKNVGVIYKERKSFFKSETYVALKNISFDVYKGETLGIIGRNGAGKSTLLRLLAGIFKPDKGEIIHHTKNVSLMALAAGFDPNLSGRKNAIFSGMLLGYRKKDIISKIEDIKKFSELQGFFEKPAKTYSSGMRARLAFSIAMYVSPDVLLIDEVLGVGDVSFKKKAELALEEKISSNITVIIVTHSESQISRLSNRVIWIDGGVVRKQGLSSEVFPEYNLNSHFSTYNLKVVSYCQNEDFYIDFEDIELIGDFIKYKCVLIDKKNRVISEVLSALDSNKSIVLDGPTATTGYGKKFPDINQAMKARYHNGIMNVGGNSMLTAKIYGVVTEIFRIVVDRN